MPKIMGSTPEDFHDVENENSQRPCRMIMRNVKDPMSACFVSVLSAKLNSIIAFASLELRGLPLGRKLGVKITCCVWYSIYMVQHYKEILAPRVCKDVACHPYTLNMPVSSGTKNNSSPNARAILHHRNGVVQWSSLGGNGYLALSILKSGDNQNAN
ncbi:hypothetical protein TNCV_2592851 [Trichonephila clavipes]|nr:hypothetical protein TNCV_2592851 [Trichonephila clavipes]